MKKLNMDTKELTLLLLGALVAIMFIFAGCALDQGGEKITDAPVEYEEEPVAVVEEVAEEVVEEEDDTVVIEDWEVESGDVQSMDEKLLERDVAPVGNRLTDDGEEEVVLPIDYAGEEILLRTDKTMSLASVALSVGETLVWKSEDEGYVHILLIEEGKVRIDQSERLEAGDSFVYTFDKEGEYLIRDIFSGTMRMTVEVS